MQEQSPGQFPDINLKSLEEEKKYTPVAVAEKLKEILDWNGISEIVRGRLYEYRTHIDGELFRNGDEVGGLEKLLERVTPTERQQVYVLANSLPFEVQAIKNNDPVRKLDVAIKTGEEIAAILFPNLPGR